MPYAPQLWPSSNYWLVDNRICFFVFLFIFLTLSFIYFNILYFIGDLNGFGSPISRVVPMVDSSRFEIPNKIKKEGHFFPFPAMT